MIERTDAELDEIMAKSPDQAEPLGPCLDDRMLSSYRDRALPADQIDPIEEHLASCPDCRALLAELQAPLPSGLSDWARSTLKRRSPRRWMVVTAALAAGVLLAVLVIPSPETVLPEYQLRGPLGGVERVRGDATASALFLPQSRFEFVLRPDASVAERISLLVFVEQDGRAVPAPGAGVAKGEGGSFRYQIEASQLFGADPGIRTVHAAVVEGEVRQPASGTIDEVRGRLPHHRWITMKVEYRTSLEDE